MRLKKEHIGKMVRLPEECTELMQIELVSEKEVVTHCLKHGYQVYKYERNWIIEEPKKKPSERIQEIIGNTSSDPEWNERAISAIIRFLDEEFEKKQ